MVKGREREGGSGGFLIFVDYMIFQLALGFTSKFSSGYYLLTPCYMCARLECILLLLSVT